MASAFVFDGAVPCECGPMGLLARECTEYGGQCKCKTNVVGRKCDQWAPGSYGLGPEVCKECDFNNMGSMSNICDKSTGHCQCHPYSFGRQCKQERANG